MNGLELSALVLALLFGAGVVVTLARLVRALERGLSIRMQVFVALVTSSFAFAALFSWVLVVRVEAGRPRAELVVEMGLVALALSVLAALCAVVIGRFVGRPIERLTAAAERIAAGRRQAPLPLPRGREVRVLTEAFESMRAELEERHALEAFVENLSHELKNPVATIKASAEVLEDAIDRDPAVAMRFVRRIFEAATRIERLTDDVLALARLEARGPSQKREPTDVCDVVREAARALETKADAAKAQVELVLPSTCVVRADREWLRRAVENLLGNGLDHAPDGSTVSVELCNESGEIVLLVRDLGPGVAPSMVERVFDRFTTTREATGGTGLGLAIVRAVAETHGGRVELRANTESGATFALILPRA